MCHACRASVVLLLVGGQTAIVDHVRTGSTDFVYGRRCTQGTRVRSAEPRARSLHVFSHHYTPLFTAIFFAEMHAIQAAPRVAPSAGLQGHWSGADAAARTPAAAPTPAAAALAVAAATDAQGRRRALRELDAAVDGHTAAATGAPPCAALCGRARRLVRPHGLGGGGDDVRAAPARPSRGPRRSRAAQPRLRGETWQQSGERHDASCWRREQRARRGGRGGRAFEGAVPATAAPPPSSRARPPEEVLPGSRQRCPFSPSTVSSNAREGHRRCGEKLVDRYLPAYSS